MTTSHKLLLGFGTLTALFIAVVAAVLVQVRSIENSVREWGPTARPRSVATRELEINAFAYVLAVRTYLHQGEPQARQEAAAAAAAVMPIVFAGAPVVNTITAMLVHPPEGKIPPLFILGCVLAVTGAALVAKFSPSNTGASAHKPAAASTPAGEPAKH